MRKIVFIILLSFGFSGFCNSLDKVDSLLTELNSTKSDSGRVNIYLALYSEIASTDIDQAISHLENALHLAKKINDPRYLVSTCFYFAYEQELKANLDSAIVYYNMAIKNAKEIKNHKIQMASYMNLGSVYSSLGKYVDATSYYMKSLQIAEDLNDSLEIANSFNNLGILQKIQGNYKEAIDYYSKALSVFEKLQDTERMLIGMNNIGTLYVKQDSFDLALKFHQKALDIAILLGEKKHLAKSYLNLGTVYYNMSSFPLAEKFLRQALAISKELNMDTQVAQLYCMLGNVLAKQNKPEEALACFEKSIELANNTENRSKPMLKYLFSEISGFYASQARFDKAYDYLQDFIKVNDSLMDEEKVRTLGDLEAKYQSEKKQKEIEIQKITIRNKELEVENLTTQNYAFTIGILFILLITIVIIWAYFQKRKSNKLLAWQKSEIEEINTQLKHSSFEIQAQSKLLESTNTELSRSNKRITDSIVYAKKIQEAILPDENNIATIFPDSFIMYKPKDIVSGDFYWVSKTTNDIIIAVADCTGHGVPGALMSMIGNTLLNEIVNEKKNREPSEILTKLNIGVNNILSRNTSAEDSTDDGMEISICRIDLLSGQMSLAGAGQLILYYEDQEKSAIPGDLYSIGGVFGRSEEARFTQKTISTSKNSILYMFSDGYYDQLGGTDDSKMSLTGFTNFIESILHLPMKDQKTRLENHFTDWINQNKQKSSGQKQLDDVLVIGIKL